jgi:alpha,alpha-trehalase
VTVLNGGNGTAGEGWAHALSRELVNRYVSGLFCSWSVILPFYFILILG